MSYQSLIAEDLNRLNRTDIDPRHVEAYMRLQHGTLDHLSKNQFIEETKICIACIDEEGIEDAELLAKSFGI